jgi:hypothetical protein
MSEMKIIIERWDRYVKEDTGDDDDDTGEPLDPGSITTVHQLHNYFLKRDPSTLQVLGAKYGGLTAKVLGIGAGAVTGGAGGLVAAAATSYIAGEVVEQMLMASIMAFANIEDGTYPGGTAATYFDLEDNLTLFLRDVESLGKDFTKPTKTEMEVFTIMKNKIKDAVQGNISASTTIATLLGDVTSQSVMDAHLKSGELAGKVKVQAAV